jgi:hypothetical protein
LQCNDLKLPEFSFSWKMFTVSRNFRLRTKFEFKKKYFCESGIFSIFISFVIFRRSYLSSFIRNTDISSNIFEKVQEYLKLSIVINFLIFSAFIKSIFTNNVRCSQNLGTFSDILKILQILYFLLFLQWLSAQGQLYLLPCLSFVKSTLNQRVSLRN